MSFLSLSARLLPTAHFWAAAAVCLALMAQGCQKNPAASGKVAKLPRNAEVDYDYFAAKGKMKIEQNEQIQRVTTDIRMKKDSLVWISLRSGAGIEGARVLATKDSFFIVNRLSKEYFAYSYPDLAEDLNVYIDLNLLQNVIIGSPVLLQNGINATTTRTEETMTIVQVLEQVRIESLVNRMNQKLTKVSIRDLKQNNEVSVEYSDFQKLTNRFTMPYLCKAALNYTDTTQVSSLFELRIENAVVTQDVMTFNFSIPDRYQRAYLWNRGKR
jgi:hypothetical protein